MILRQHRLAEIIPLVLRAVPGARGKPLQRGAAGLEPLRVEAGRRQLEVDELQQRRDVVAGGRAIDFLDVRAEPHARVRAPGAQEALERRRRERAVAHRVDRLDQVHRVVVIDLLVEVLPAVAGGREQDLVALEVRRLQDDTDAVRVGERRGAECGIGGLGHEPAGLRLALEQARVDLDAAVRRQLGLPRLAHRVPQGRLRRPCRRRRREAARTAGSQARRARSRA